jgi:hypothetical protein
LPLDGSYDSAALLLDLKSASSDLATCKYISSIACCRTYSKGNAYGAKGKKRRISHVALSYGVDVSDSWFFDRCAKCRVRILTGCVLCL